jgi:tetratricopeptide (TPR) repeat protein
MLANLLARSAAHETAAGLLSRFFEHYGTQFDWERTRQICAMGESAEFDHAGLWSCVDALRDAHRLLSAPSDGTTTRLAAIFAVPAEKLERGFSGRSSMADGAAGKRSDGVLCAAAMRAKDSGNAMLGQKAYAAAYGEYTLAIASALGDNRPPQAALASLYSNRAASASLIGAHKHALQDAERAVLADPSWAKGYFRKGSALLALGRAAEAERASSVRCESIRRMRTSARALPRRRPVLPAARCRRRRHSGTQAKPRAEPCSPTDQTARADVQCRRRLQLVRIIDESERQHRDAISELFVNVKYPCAAPRRAAAASYSVSARRFRP